jgi:DNA-binding response OmpR family regulator
MKKVLCVDDHKNFRELVSVTLGKEYQVFHAESGEESIVIAEREMPDLIIMDIVLNGKMNGLETTKHIKMNSTLQSIHILILSSKCTDKDLALAYKNGADDYLIKPFSPTLLVKKVEEFLTLKH